MSIRKTLAVLLTAGTIAAFGLSAKPAHADLVPTLVGPPTPITTGTYAGDYLFTYSVALSQSSEIGGATPNAFVTLYDINGLPSGPNSTLSQIDLQVNSNPLGVTPTPSLQKTGVTPTLTSPADDPTIPNLTFTLTNSTIVTGPVNPILIFSFADTLPSFSDFDAYGGFTTNSTNNTGQSNIGSVQLPSGTRITATPEPASYAAFVLGGLGLLGLGLKARRRQTVA